MKKCLYCGKPVRNKYCDVSCQNKHQNAEKANKRFGELKSFNVLCKKCGKEFEVEEREKLFPSKENYYCSKSCANSRTHSNTTKETISNSLLEFNKLANKCKQHYNCLYCGKDIESNRERKFCSHSCSMIWRTKEYPEFYKENSIKGGRQSVLSQNRRSKNEILFGDLCVSYFNNVKLNEPIFNGWDADIILEDCKLAILWNGNWHHKQIGLKHSLEQVKNRDNIKIKEIKESGYEPYIINDYGKYNEEFVKNEFDKLKLYLL
jgi:predicted nucleic acid-binding Zn ribbon protein